MGPLSQLLLMPVVGVVLIALLPANRSGLIRPLALVVSTLALLMAIALYLGFDASSASMQFAESRVWNSRLGTSFALGVDGISLSMVLLGTLLTLVAIAASASIREGQKGYYLLMLLLESAMLGVFMAQDWALFYLFWELTLIPLFFLIDRWGGKRRQTAALNFVLYTMGGSIFILLSLLLLFDSVPGHSFAMADMARGAVGLSPAMQLLIFLGLLIGFGVKIPLFPLHGWLPLAHVEAPSPVSILLSGILLKMGAYGLIRAAALLPQGVGEAQSGLMALGTISLIYGAVLAWRQSDLKGMVAYSSVSHMGVVVLGIATLNTTGLIGAVMQMVAHGLVAAALFLLVGLLYERSHSREVNDYSALVRVAPRFAFFLTLGLMAAVAMPGSAGFIAELHTLIGGYYRWGWWVLVLSLGMLISAAYAIRTVNIMLTGPVRQGVAEMPDLRRGEVLMLSLLSLGFLGLGLAPAPALNLISATLGRIGAQFSG